MATYKEPRFLLDDFLDKDRKLLGDVVKEVNKKNTNQDKNAIFLKELMEAMLREKTKENIKLLPKKVERKPLEIKLPIIEERPLIIEARKPIEEKIELPFPQYEEISYDLIKDKDGKVLVKANYKDQEKTYILTEPEINDADKELLKVLVKELDQKINKNKKLIDDKVFLMKVMNRLSKKMGLIITLDYVEKLRYYLIRDILNFGKIDPLLIDKHVKEIICDGADNPVYIVFSGHENIKTNVVYRDPKEINKLVEKYATISKQKLTEKNPFLNVTMDNIKFQGTVTSKFTTPKFIIKKL